VQHVTTAGKGCNEDTINLKHVSVAPLLIRGNGVANAGGLIVGSQNRSPRLSATGSKRKSAASA